MKKTLVLLILFSLFPLSAFARVLKLDIHLRSLASRSARMVGRLPVGVGTTLSICGMR